MTNDALAAALLALTAVAALTDSRTGLIPNWLTLPVMALAPWLQLWLGGGSALARSLIGLAVCAAIPLALFRAGAMGGGDVKLLGAIGALAGPFRGLEVQLLAYNVLVLFACVVLALRGQLRAVLRGTLDAMRSLGGRGAGGRDALQSPTAFRLGVPILVSTWTLLAMELAR